MSVNLLHLQAVQERTWKNHVETIHECRVRTEASLRAFYKAEKTFKEAYTKQEEENDA